LACAAPADLGGRIEPPVGVDLEPAGASDFDGLADVALTPRERLALRRLPSEQRSSAALT